MFRLLTTLVCSIFLISSASAEKIVIKGSDTLGAKLVPQLKEEFAAKHSKVAFEISAEGSSTGIAAIIDGTADIAMSSRDIHPDEVSKAKLNGKTIIETTIALDAIAIIVNENNPIDNLSSRQVERIFTGRAADWSAVGGVPGEISVYTRNTSSGTYSDFKKMAMRKKDYGERTQKLAGNEQIASEVGRNSNGIGYVGLAYVNSPGVKVISINGIAPTSANVRNASYSLARPLHFYTAGSPAGNTARFIEFTISEEGQKIVEEVAFVRAR